MESDKTGVFRITDVERAIGVSDMFWADVRDVGWKEDILEGKRDG